MKSLLIALTLIASQVAPVAAQTEPEGERFYTIEQVSQAVSEITASDVFKYCITKSKSEILGDEFHAIAHSIKVELNSDSLYSVEGAVNVLKGYKASRCVK